MTAWLNGRYLPLEEARSADELFITGTSPEVRPVTSLDGKSVGSGHPGPVALRLGEAYRDLVKREMR